MVLLSYYGTGKTILLLERAEFLLRDQRNTVHFVVDNANSGIIEVLKLRFGCNSNIKIKTTHRDQDLLSDGVNPTDHLIIDEAYVNTTRKFLSDLQLLKSGVSSLWVAIGSFSSTEDANFNESDFRKGLEDIHFYCPTLTHCLRNGQKILKEALKDKSKGGLNCLADQVKVKTNVNDGLLYEMPHIYQDPIKALQETLKVHDSKRTFIVLDKYIGLEMSSLKEAIPEHDFVTFEDKEALKKWLESTNMNHHLVLQGFDVWNTQVSGMEFKNMLFLYSVCLKCNFGYKDARILTRAKASLVIARYQNENCNCTNCTQYWASSNPRFRFKIEQKMQETKN